MIGVLSRSAVGSICVLIAVAAMPATAFAQQIGGGHTITVPLIKLSLGLLLCSLVAVLAALAIKRFTTHGGILLPQKDNFRGWLRTPPRRIQILETHRISPHADICRLSFNDKEYVVVVSPGGATTLLEATLQDPELPGPRERPS